MTARETAAVTVVVLVCASLLGYRAQRWQAERDYAACRKNSKNIGTALEMYSTDASGRFPARAGLRALVPQYLAEIPTCPSAGRDTYSVGYACGS